MTKKHFKVIANKIAEMTDYPKRNEFRKFFGNICQDINPRFDWERWNLACAGLEYKK